MQSAQRRARVLVAGGALLLAACMGGRGAAQEEGPATLASQEEAAMRAAVESVSDSVVQIRTIGGLETVDRTLIADGPTTGLVISVDGYVVSSAFNFVQQPASILVTFASGEQAPAELVATDHSRMIVLLKVHGVSDLAVPEMTPVDEIHVGQWAIAVGRTFRPDRANVSVGIVSALDRMFGKVIQTDADLSTANYGGPLVDVRGRVLGVAVPMAPQSTSEVAGVEWYDSGIGFAVPLSSLGDRLERMKQGEDQRAGLLGIGLAAGDPHDSPAELAAVLPNGPAGGAGLQKGDRVVQIDDQPIQTQSDLRFALGPRYAGDRVHVVVQRGEERLERDIELAGELEPFRHGFLGILPMRPAEVPDDKTTTNSDDADHDEDQAAEEQTPGIVVRMVYSGSAAAEAGVRSGDRILEINHTAVDSVDAAVKEMNAFVPGSKVAVQLERDGQPLDLELTSGRLPTNAPAELPPAYAPVDRSVSDGGEKPAEAGDLKLPEFSQSCRVYVPPLVEAGYPVGVLVWLHAPGASQPDAVIRRWQPICDRDGLILVVPTAADTNRWERTELGYLRRVIEQVVGQYRVDRQRVVVYGRGGGGAMAHLLALSSRDVVRGVATSDAPLPRTARVPANDSARRLAVFMELAQDSSLTPNFRQSIQKYTAAGYPVTAVSLDNQQGELSADGRERLAQWIDTLDRL